MAPAARPSLRLERALLRDGARLVVGMDEVGRGALAGPVSVGAVALDLHSRTGPRGVADSKLLTAAARTALLPALGRWGRSRAVGHASPAEIDERGIVGALRLAGQRALAAIESEVGAVDVVVLDGTHDWLTPPLDLFTAFEGPAFHDPPFGAPALDDPAFNDAASHDAASHDAAFIDTPAADDGASPGTSNVPHVMTKAKADQSCASVAAASVLAKCERDALMAVLHSEHPDYCWADNKGYGAPEHLAALSRLGPSPHHRVSWRLPGVTVPAAAADGG